MLEFEPTAEDIKTAVLRPSCCIGEPTRRLFNENLGAEFAQGSADVLVCDCCGNWTPDGKYYLFQAARQGRIQIWAIRERVSFWEKFNPNPVQVTTGPMNIIYPLPSRDGKKLFVLGAQRKGQLVHFDAKSGGWTPYLSGIWAEQVSFSKDGKWVVYIADPDSKPTLWRAKMDGTERLQLTYPPVIAGLPRWSPDGKQIAYAAHEPGKPWNTYVVSVATIAAGKLLDVAGGSEQLFGAGTYADVFGEILPAHDAGAVDEELRWTGDVVAIRSRCDMQQIVTADYI